MAQRGKGGAQGKAGAGPRREPMGVREQALTAYEPAAPERPQAAELSVYRWPLQAAEGLPFAPLRTLAKRLGMSTGQLAETYLDMSRSTLARRRQRDRLMPDEAAKVLRYTHLLESALGLTHGNEAAARRWLTSPRHILRGETPLEHARTEAGACDAETLIGRIRHGIPS